MFDFTDAHLVVLLDNLNASKLDDSWARALNIKDKEGSGRGAHFIRTELEKLKTSGKRTGEGEWLGQWLGRAMEQDREGRIIPYGLRERDIIQYIPVDRLLPGADSWREVTAEWRRAPRRGDELPSLKKWLYETKGVKTNAEHLRNAALDVPAPSDLSCDALVTPRG
ncbi:hypothetical protein [Ornithinimicrobium panacihumi]|uniref:hypothetical protein n=1 Tax=Ornithinimicrobium panacihumi TaxID=2008449 RepID=UPI003F8BC72B